jgi:hypothetical protein
MATLTTKPCMVCKAATVVEVTTAEFTALNAGELIQFALPDREPAFRELLISGTHGDCWDMAFPDELDD